MSDQDLYEIARQRIDRRNRRWTLWAVDLAGLIASVAAVVLLADTRFELLSVAAMIAWGGVFTLHTIVAATAHSRDEDIEKEVAKLRQADLAYEKPKRIHLTEDGELAEYDEWEDEKAKRKLEL